MSEPTFQTTRGAGEGVRNEVIEAVKAVHQELPLCMALRQHVALIGEDNIKHLLQLILDVE